MKFSVLSTTSFFAAAVSAKPCSNKCFNAIVFNTPASLGQAYCSSFLSIKPLAPVTATVTVTRDVVATTTHTNSETTTTEVTTGTTVTATSLAIATQASSPSSTEISVADPLCHGPAPPVKLGAGSNISRGPPGTSRVSFTETPSL